LSENYLTIPIQGDPMSRPAVVLLAIVLVGLAVPMFVSLRESIPGETGEAGQAQIKAEVTQALDDWIQSYGGMDCDETSRFYHPQFLAAASGGEILDYAAHNEGCQSFFEGKDGWKGYWVETNVRVISPDAAEFSAIMGDTVWYSSGLVRERPGTCANVGVMVRTDEGWKFTIAAQSCGSSRLLEEG
jgi:hypothetical protein